MNDVPVKRSPWVAGLMSILMPGLGQIYNGQMRRSLKFLISFIAIIGLSRSHAVLWGGVSFYFVLILALALLWFWLLIDAVVQARTPRPWTVFNRWYVFPLCFFAIPLFATIAIGLLKLAATAEPFSIPANSMAPTVQSGDYVMVDKLAFRFQKPKAGEIAVFRFPKDESINYIKRIVAVEGDWVMIQNRNLFVNEKKVEIEPLSDPLLFESLEEEDKNTLSLFTESLAGKKYPVLYNLKSGLNSDFGAVRVPPDSYFVLGDNRDKSSDSRFWGTVSAKNLVGRPKYIYMSLDDRKGGIRWERVGKSVD